MLMWVLIVGEAIYAFVGQGLYGNSVLSAQYCCELKAALKNNKDYLKGKKHKCSTQKSQLDMSTISYINSKL